MKSKIFYLTRVSRLIGAAVILALCTVITGCRDDKTMADAYRYEHVDLLARRHASVIDRAASVSAVDLQKRLLDIHSCCHLLDEEGDTLMALFFKYSIEEKVRQINPQLADSIFRPVAAL